MRRRSVVWAASDDALLAGMAAGDRDAAVAFVRRFQRRVFGVARAIVNDAGVAEDVAQEAFYRAWHAAGSYDGRRGSVATWLNTITRNLAVDALRLRRAEPVDPDDLVAAIVAAARDDPETVAMRDADADQLRAALAELPDGQRRAVVAAVFFGRTAAEIAAIDNIPLGTAKTRIRTGLQRLRARWPSDV